MSDAYVREVQRLYDRMSAPFLRFAGNTIQAGLIPTPGATGLELPHASNLLLAERAGIQPGQRILDAGCGIGGPSIHIAQAWSDVRIDAVTISAVQADMARKSVEDAGLGGRVTVHLLDYHDLPFPDAAFDVVMFLESTGYSYDPDALFAEVHRLLKPGGRVYIKDLFAVDKDWTPDEIEQLDGVNQLWCQRRVPTKEDWVARLSAAGFEDLHVDHLADANSHYFFGAMFNSDFTLNEFGEEFFRSFPSPDLVHYGEVRGRKPSSAGS